MARKYSRDNAGRFASGGTGATARGGRLKTASGGKRATQTRQIAAAPKTGTVAKPKGLKQGAVTARVRAKAARPMASKVTATGQDLARRWSRAGEAARRRGIDSYAPPNRKKAERAAQVDAAARGFRGAMAGAPGLRYRNAMTHSDTQKKAATSFKSRPKFSTKQKVKKAWI